MKKYEIVFAVLNITYTLALRFIILSMKSIYSILFIAVVLSACKKAETVTKSSPQSESTQVFPLPEEDASAALQRPLPCPAAIGIPIVTYDQSLVVATDSSLIVGGSEQFAPVNTVINIEYRVWTGNSWGSRVLNYVYTINSPTMTFLSFSLYISNLEPNTYVLYRPWLYIPGCLNPIRGDWEIVHTLI